MAFESPPECMLPPEVIFHRFFQQLPPDQRKRYRGKADLNRLKIPTFPQGLLEKLQSRWNEALSLAPTNVAGHVEHGAFHFDYVDSDVENAIAFAHGGYSFIGITVPLINRMWEIAERVSASELVAARICGRLTPQQRESFHIVLFRVQIAFTVCHEYTHHVHGHAYRSLDETFLSEVDISRTLGDLEQQTIEADADGYAVYFVLSNLLTGEERAHVTEWLGLAEREATEQDTVLFAVFVAATGAAMFARAPQSLVNGDVYRLSHPPQAVRMNLLMHRAVLWAKQNRPALNTWMTRERFASLMEAVAEAGWRTNGGADWTEQNDFLRSAEGAEYFRRLHETLNEYVTTRAWKLQS